MNVVLQHVRPDFRNKVFLQWTIVAPDVSAIPGVTFTIERSGFPAGPWETIATGVDDRFYEDVLNDAADDNVEINILPFRRELWYRVTATLQDNRVLVSSPVDLMNNRGTRYEPTIGVGIVPREDHSAPHRPNLFHANPNFKKRLMLVQRHVLRRTAVNFRHLSGIEVVVLKRRTFGTRCSFCYDAATKQSLISNCSECYGTGFQGGYWTPLIVSCLLRRYPATQNIELEGETEAELAEVGFLDFPRIEKEDVIIEVDSRNAWEIGDQMMVSALKQRQVLQQWRCSKADRNHPAYSVPLDFTELTRIEAIV